MSPQGSDTRWADLESRAHHPEVQELIRQEIRKGTIRVTPTPGGGIHITPCRPAEPPTIPPGLSPTSKACVGTVGFLPATT